MQDPADQGASATAVGGDGFHANRAGKEGNILISVHTENSTERARAKEIFEQVGAEDIADTAEARV